MFKKILVPLDGSKRAEGILPKLEKIRECCQAEVHLLQVVVSYKIDPEKEKTERQQLMREAQAYLDKTAARLRRKNIKTFTAVANSQDAIQICDYAAKKKFDLIAMASHGRSGLGPGGVGRGARE